MSNPIEPSGASPSYSTAEDNHWAARGAAWAAGLDPREIVGTGRDGLLTFADVQAAISQGPRRGHVASGASARQALPNMAATHGRPSVTQTLKSVFDPWVQVTVDAYSSTPLTDDLKQANPRRFQDANSRPGAVLPSLFVAGELPLLTASGIEPTLLLQLPWTIRHATAAIDSLATVNEIFERCGGKDLPAVQLAFVLALNDKRLKDHTAHGWEEYRKRVDAWEYPPPPPRTWQSVVMNPDGTTSVRKVSE